MKHLNFSLNLELVEDFSTCNGYLDKMNHPTASGRGITWWKIFLLLAQKAAGNITHQKLNALLSYSQKLPVTTIQITNQAINIGTKTQDISFSHFINSGDTFFSIKNFLKQAKINGGGI